MKNCLLRFLISVYLVQFCILSIAQIPHANGNTVLINGSKWAIREDRVANTCELSSYYGEVYTGHVQFPDKVIIKRNVNDEVIEVTLTVVSIHGSSSLSDIEMNVESLTFPSSVKKIHFFKPPKLRSITIMGSIESIYFGECENLESIYFGGSISNIEKGAFNHCKKLREIIIPGSVGSIEERAFLGCSNLETVTFLSSLKKIGNNAFLGCRNLRKINIPNSVTEIGERAFSLCESLEYIQIPSSVRTMGDFTFHQCSVLKSATIAGNIGNYSFFYCSDLTNVHLFSPIQSIGSNAFNSCSNLQSIVIPQSVKVLGSGAFSSCEKLNSVIFYGSSVEMGNVPFLGVGTEDQPCILYYPSDWSLKTLSQYSNSWYGGYFKIAKNVLEAMTPISDNVEYDFYKTFTESTDLNGKIEGNIYFALNNKEDNGYMPEEGCVIIKTPMTDQNINALHESISQGNGVTNDFCGLLAYQSSNDGKNGIIIDYQTKGDRQLNVKMGDNPSVKLKSENRTENEIYWTKKYGDSQTIIIYADGHGYIQARTRSDSDSDCVKIFRIKFIVNGIVESDINSVYFNPGNCEEHLFNLHGRQINSPAPGINLIKTKDGKVHKFLMHK